MSSFRRLLLPLGAMLLAGCAIPFRQHGTVTSALARKRVTAKLAPDTLVAEDRTRCVPAESKYAQVARGDEVWCLWVPAAAGAGAGAASPDT